ncbi:hypothetical protein MZD04_gp001 [Pseudomonas phage Psa21]|uniref:Uncharacterized protein n=1 Tax=Pseudomonas phage Psa21 TaxID=2530023 RepID=A0A481W4B8_9CAUD|nr:hypothetical protein MZD04_gp001 [Pseudomonas phage Psa21]QBJ02531.1 hypothetical protein PSA21_1 [Pseudomonas phage Psa21]
MPFYIPKPEPIEVHRWFKNGDAPGDGVINNINSGAVVARHHTYRHFTGAQLCPKCNKRMADHGTIQKRMGELEFVVCPGDWVRIHRDDKKRILGYSVITDKVITERYINMALLQPKPQEKVKR